MSRFKLFSLIFCCLLAALSLCSCELAMEAMYGTPAFTKVNVLVYGNEYSTSPTGIINGVSYTANPLNYTIDDAKQVGMALEALTGCTATYSSNTSKEVFRTSMENLANTSTPSELTIIYFSCHGFNEDKGEKKEYEEEIKTSFIMCSETSTTFDVYKHAEFKEDLAKIKGTKVVFADVCYSGGLVDSSNVSINPNEYSGIDVFSLFWDYQVSEASDTFYLTASRYNQKSHEYEAIKHGLFTLGLLEALGWDEENQKIVGRSGLLTFFDICQYVVKNNKSSSDARQDPMLNSGSNDIVLFYIK